MATLDFNATEVEPSSGFEAIPTGEYIAIITDTEIKQTKAGTGRFIKFEFEVIEGDYKGRKLWANINIDNPNADAVKIGRAELSALCFAVGVSSPRDTVELHNLPLQVKVSCRKNKETDELENVIKSYKKKPSFAPNATNHATPTAANASAPWAKK